MDARIICATNRNLEEAVQQGTFRWDLFYRLNVGHIFLPPLRARREEILPLAQYFLAYFSRQKNKGFGRISPETAVILEGYDWPGNVRELRNLMELAVFHYEGVELEPEHLSNLQVAWRHRPSKGPTAAVSILKKHTSQFVSEALQLHNGNKTATADYLGISRRSLYRLLERMGFNEIGAK